MAVGMDERQACSQPQMSVKEPRPLVSAAVDLDPDTLCFSQPAKPDHLLLASSPGDSGTAGSSASSLQRLVRRMTRVLVNSTLQETLQHLNDLFDKLCYRTSAHTPNVVSLLTLPQYIYIFSSILLKL